jgi:hypothetical protein
MAQSDTLWQYFNAIAEPTTNNNERSIFSVIPSLKIHKLGPINTHYTGNESNRIPVEKTTISATT